MEKITWTLHSFGKWLDLEALHGSCSSLASGKDGRTTAVILSRKIPQSRTERAISLLLRHHVSVEKAFLLWCTDLAQVVGTGKLNGAT